MTPHPAPDETCAETTAVAAGGNATDDNATRATGGATTAGARLLDNRSAPCAVGLIRAARLMQELPPGSVLEIWSRDRFAPMEVPLWAQRDGYAVEQRPSAGRWPLKHFIFVVSKPA